MNSFFTFIKKDDFYLKSNIHSHIKETLNYSKHNIIYDKLPNYYLKLKFEDIELNKTIYLYEVDVSNVIVCQFVKISKNGYSEFIFNNKEYYIDNETIINDENIPFKTLENCILYALIEEYNTCIELYNIKFGDTNVNQNYIAVLMEENNYEITFNKVYAINNYLYTHNGKYDDNVLNVKDKNKLLIFDKHTFKIVFNMYMIYLKNIYESNQNIKISKDKFEQLLIK